MDLVRALDRALDADGALVALREQVEHTRHARRRAGVAPSSRPVSTAVALPGSRPTVDGEGFSVPAPAGRFFAGAAVPARAYPASDDGRILAAVPNRFAEDPFVRHPRRGLVVGVVDGQPDLAMFGDGHPAGPPPVGRRTGSHALLMPRAYALDDLTLGVVWAVTNLDDALLNDDAALAESGEHMHVYEQLPRSAAGRDVAADLAPVSQMWLGSQFCASHILRHANSLSDTPRFWTREQRGEEASTWLLFAHKYTYLARSAGTGEPAPRRAFCIPSAAVAASGRPERILLLLAIALMESFGITVDVCDEPEYAALPGFVSDDRRRVILATWVGTDGVWQVDVTDSPSLLREFADATGYARAHSVVAAATPGARLAAMSTYLDLDWAWLVRRCAELGEYGSGGIAAPRSRHLSTEGLDRACRFLAQAAPVGR